MRKVIENREDIALLVKNFYTAVRANDTIGPIFNSIIKDWEEHLNLLTDFWETNLLGNMLYKGNPLEAHVAVDQKIPSEISQEHFGTWLQLWFETIDKHFEGKIADTAKRRAQKMSTFMYIQIFKSRT